MAVQDQLKREKEAGRIFRNFSEAPITFCPTYKVHAQIMPRASLLGLNALHPLRADNIFATSLTKAHGTPLSTTRARSGVCRLGQTGSCFAARVRLPRSRPMHTLHGTESHFCCC